MVVFIRSWRICAVAIRSALSLGLHLRSESQNIAPLSKEIQYRVWWALYMLDNFLCAMTGRPPCTDRVSCATPLPVPYEEGKFQEEYVTSLITDQQNRDRFMTSLLLQENWNTPKGNLAHHTPLRRSALEDMKRTDKSGFTLVENLSPNESLYFLYMLDLTFIMREALDTLYTREASHKSWAEFEFAIATLNSNADSWYARLPTHYQLDSMYAAGPLWCQSVSLAFRFYSTKLIISKPCFDRRAQRSTGASGTHGAVCEAMASVCIQSAIQILDLFPDDPDPAWIYGLSPSWCALHYIMQSTTILLTEYLFQSQPCSDTAEIAKRVQKATRWLRTMSIEDPPSQRAWLVCKDIVLRFKVKLGLDVEIGDQELYSD